MILLSSTHSPIALEAEGGKKFENSMEKRENKSRFASYFTNCRYFQSRSCFFFNKHLLLIFVVEVFNHYHKIPGSRDTKLCNFLQLQQYKDPSFVWLSLHPSPKDSALEIFGSIEILILVFLPRTSLDWMYS